MLYGSCAKTDAMLVTFSIIHADWSEQVSLKQLAASSIHVVLSKGAVCDHLSYLEGACSIHIPVQYGVEQAIVISMRSISQGHH